MDAENLDKYLNFVVILKRFALYISEQEVDFGKLLQTTSTGLDWVLEKLAEYLSKINE